MEFLLLEVRVQRVQLSFSIVFDLRELGGAEHAIDQLEDVFFVFFKFRWQRSDLSVLLGLMILLSDSLIRVRVIVFYEIAFDQFRHRWRYLDVSLRSPE